ncbi:MAG: rhomboid family intramembrane serine protease [Bacteroidia bacterium]|nr:rhomboid family intramembrane serine protease [Bacteroidia bacterium]MCC7533778.1 rhomboid family intramembrane serine protease [Bacteroidia bacterium]
MTIYIIIITSIVSIVCFYNNAVYRQLILNPYLVKEKKEWYRLFSSGLMHADFLHLFVNMFVLYSFGNVVEFYYQIVFGDVSKWIFILLYITSIAAANFSTQYKYQNSSYYNSLGASGAVSAVVFTSILFDPFNKIYLYGLIGIPGIILGILYLGYSYYMSKRNSDNTNHEAHFYGAVYGVLFTLVLKPKVFLFFIEQLRNF